MIKLAQYGCHRPDLLNLELIENLKHLKENAPSHSFKETEKILKDNQIYDKIVEIDKNPIASGIIGQVYRAKIIQDDGSVKDVALKVRHPKILQNMNLDLHIIYAITNVLSKVSFLKWIRVPVTYEECQSILINQTDFRIEGNNTNKFYNNFYHLNKMIEIPKIYYQSEDVLVEEFMVDSLNVGEYIDKKDLKVNKRLAQIGINLFLKMLIYDNFIHADCHSGNIFVKKLNKNHENNNNILIHYKQRLDAMIYEVAKLVEYQLFKVYTFFFEMRQEKDPTNLPSIAERIKNLNKQYYQDLVQSAHEVIKSDSLEQNYSLVLLDCGMVTQLSQNDHKSIIKLVKAIITKDPVQSSINIQRMSTCDNKINYDYFQKDLEVIFQQIVDIPLQNINFGQMINQIVMKAQERKIVINASAAFLLSNIVVLEGLAKSLDPDVNIIGQALPYLINKRVVKYIFQE
ncbi:Protein kinase-like domain [Pseudocohnilembus persalinus]|uniref:Protein kinase-like domain n=1 Tax=Pseudocohnilembus persalinus TaxID=266149 RepID=A0A0V0QCG9_PSEPJ|nr:Protein kinase-like domain [Pseudocohnilembus persalinus]|eukprot:KRW99948.1 Protein kinase-like domain [Pseudocohnilembus persalinus]